MVLGGLEDTPITIDVYSLAFRRRLSLPFSTGEHGRATTPSASCANSLQPSDSKSTTGTADGAAHLIRPSPFQL